MEELAGDGWSLERKRTVDAGAIVFARLERWGEFGG
jgi:hypothetical protein